MEAWAYQFGVQLDFIRPGKPVENSYIESFNVRLRDECLNVEVFFAIADVRDKLEHWRRTTTRCGHTAPCEITHRRASLRNGKNPRRPVRNKFRPRRECPQRAKY
jgi:putative transposase